MTNSGPSQFIDGEEYNQLHGSALNLVWVSALIRVDGPTVLLDEAVLYPATGAKQEIGVAAVLAVFRDLREQARTQGFDYLAIAGWRSSGARPKRMLYISRDLR